MSHSELKKLAEDKAANLLNNTQIRLVADLGCDYWLFRKNNVNYIGSLIEEPMPNFFSNKPVYEMVNKDNKTIGWLQKLN